MNNQQTKKSQIEILIVDDQLDNLRVLSQILNEQGYLVRKALSGKLALNTCQKSLPDLILLDINMPDMNGYQVCQRLKENPKTCRIPIIFISALDDVLDKEKAFDIGGVDYITKPFQVREVILRIENHLKLNSLQLKLQEQNVALQQEIAERQKIQESLELSEDRNRSLLDAIPDLMLRISKFGVLLDYIKANNSLQAKTNSLVDKIHGGNYIEFFHKDNVVGKNLSEVLSSDLSIWLMYYVEEVLLTSEIKIGEYVQQINSHWHAYEARFVKSGEDEVLVLVRDISERKQAEAERLKSEALLTSQKQQLEKALNDLKNAQVQLIQNEKMVALGQLVAGIAHEINNPVNFIYANLTYAHNYIEELINIVQAYQEEYPNPSHKIQELVKDVELNFLIEDVQSIIDAMHKGAKRIQQIVLSLQNFSRLNESEMKSVDIHEGIDNTILVLQHKLRERANRPAIEIIKEYGELRLVNCYASQLNQVFLNLLNNAIDAIDLKCHQWSEAKDENLRSFNPKIRIVTESIASNKVRIRIADNGNGIADSVRSRLFDPFFTTKPVGSGTGLGLSISYQIVVQKHGGRLTCCSSPGEGSEFAIEIPVEQINNPFQKNED
ncbi:MAG TPA: response regulator [Leptolyngbyaceae cyanobacterium]